MPLSPAIQKEILARKRARFERESKQQEIFSQASLFKRTVEAKLIGLASGRQMDNFARCGAEEIFCTCSNCGHVERFFYSCNRKWCPLCAPKLARLRAAKLALWARTIEQPKHLVLTMRNFPVLTRPKIRQFQKALAKLRKRNLWDDVRGGCMSIEVTNGGDGWHLHAHCLLDVRFIDIRKVAVEWGSLVGQEFGICFIKDCRGTDYLAEVSKYVAKGSELAKWDGNQIWEFVCAIRGVRFFFAFGSLHGMQRQIKAQLHAMKPEREPCKCGCTKFHFDTEASAILGDIRRMKRR